MDLPHHHRTQHLVHHSLLLGTPTFPTSKNIIDINMLSELPWYMFRKIIFLLLSGWISYLWLELRGFKNIHALVQRLGLPKTSDKNAIAKIKKPYKGLVYHRHHTPALFLDFENDMPSLWDFNHTTLRCFVVGSYVLKS